MPQSRRPNPLHPLTSRPRKSRRKLTPLRTAANSSSANGCRTILAAHGGDGLGPVFNDSSCVACHNQGGIGGGGAASKNVDIITAFPLPTAQTAPQAQNTLPEALFNSLFGALAPPAAAQPQTKAVAKATSASERKEAMKRDKEALAKIHPAFALTRSVVLHHFGTDPKYQAWRSQMASGQFQQQTVITNFNGIRTVTAVPVTTAAIDTDTVVQAPSVAAPAIDPAPAPTVADAAAPPKLAEDKATTPQATSAPAVPTLPPPVQVGTIVRAVRATRKTDWHTGDR